MKVSIYDIDPDHHANPRGDVYPEDVEELQNSITSIHKESGGTRALLEPIGIEPHPTEEGKYALLYGWRRYWALRWLHEKSEAPCAWASEADAIVDIMAQDRSTCGAELYALVENIQRENMPPIKEALAIRRLLRASEGSAMTQSDVASLLGKSEGWISQRLSLLDLAPPVQQALEDGNISFGVARELNRVSDPELQQELAEAAAEKKQRVSDVKAEIDKRTRPAPSEEASDDNVDEAAGPEAPPLSLTVEDGSSAAPTKLPPALSLLADHVHGLGVLIPGMSARAAEQSRVDQAFHAGMLLGLTHPHKGGVISPLSRAEMTKHIDEMSAQGEGDV